MKCLLSTLVLTLSLSTGWAHASSPDMANSNADFKSLLEDLFDGADGGDGGGELIELLESFLGEAENANIDLGEILTRLEAIDLSAITEEIEALRQEFGLYRYRYGAADAVYSEGDLPAFWNLSAACRDTFGEGARLARTGDAVMQLQRGTLPTDLALRVIFKSSFPVALGDTLYDTQENSEVDTDGLLIYSVDQDRFVEKDPASSASPACSLPS